MPRLIVLAESGPIREWTLHDVSSLGRHPSQSIQLLDRLVSKEHAVIELLEGAFVLKDLGSRNGTFVNNTLIAGPVTLKEGDKLVLGGTNLVFVDDEIKTTNSPVKSRVTIAPELIQSAIAAKLDHADTSDFAPEASIGNEDELRRQYEKLRVAYQLQRDIALEVEQDTLLGKIMDSLFSALRCDRAVILLLDNDNNLQTRCVKTSENTSKSNAQQINVSHTILDQVIREKTAVLSSDATMDDRFRQAHSIIVQGIRSTMSVPLISHDVVLGVIHLDTLMATGAFTERDLHIVQGLATQAALAIENARLVGQRENDAALREKFSRLMSPNLVEQMLAGQLAIEKGGESRHSTVLFTDLRGFTAMSQRQQPEEVVQMLNEFFEFMVDIVFEYEGTLDKYMGDGLMAVWGSPVEIVDGPFKAVCAALKMQQALQEFNDIREAEDLLAMHMGVGIDSGDLVAGYMGSTKTMNFTVIGPPVNLSSRLCSIARPNQVLISENTLKLLGERFRYSTLDPIQLKGIEHPVTPYNVTGYRETTRVK